MQKIAPLSLAELSWDNVGCLVEAPFPRQSNKVTLCIDTTEEVIDECINNHTSVIVSYHPPIFSSLKRLQMSDIKQRIVLKAIGSGISIYSPHTSLDACLDGSLFSLFSFFSFFSSYLFSLFSPTQINK